jgi:hypothetical protein
MLDIQTWPSSVELQKEKAKTPAYMVPNDHPYAVISEGYLSADLCETISEAMSSIQPYKFPHCGAVTRECPWPSSVLDEIEFLTRAVNNLYWQYDLNQETRSWLQTYTSGGDYQLHMDGSLGQTRKLTAVALLTDANSYSGGELVLRAQPMTYEVPRTQGTVVIFPHWLLHSVSMLRSGSRQTINMGFWGPYFR